MTSPNSSGPQVSATFQLLRDLAAGAASLEDTQRFYEAAADAATRNPAAARRIEEIADRRARQRADRRSG